MSADPGIATITQAITTSASTRLEQPILAR
jgi:hypothetical protein